MPPRQPRTTNGFSHPSGKASWAEARRAKQAKRPFVDAAQKSLGRTRLARRVREIVGCSNRRLIAALLLLAYAVAATGLPLSTYPIKPPTTERFPCEDCPCGCSTAEFCWTQCCCHSLEQRLAWAAKENVRPPQKVLAQARCAGHDVSRWMPGVKPLALTAKIASSGKQKRCCCCQAKAAPAKQPQQEPKPPQQTSWRTLACGGAVQMWLSIAVALPLELSEFFSEPPIVAAFNAPLPIYASRAPVPPTPPPERLS